MKVGLMPNYRLPYKFKGKVWEARESNKNRLHFILTTEMNGEQFRLKEEVPLWCLSMRRWDK